MKLLREPINLVYDGRCQFCIRTLALFRWLDVLGALHLHDATRLEVVLARFPMLAGADLEDAMWAVTDGGQVYRGFFAFRRMVWGSPLTWPLIPIFYFPVASIFGPRIYAWVAQNRHTLGCQSDVCTRPPQSAA